MGGHRVREENMRENHEEGAFKCPLGVEPPRVTIPGEGPLLVTLGVWLGRAKARDSKHPSSFGYI